ncbi:MAG: hypothetical protein HQM11_03715 [SAR324 cluster bacterium]|nr:hypothetical protein [SAR324 cluster bacterium]
MKILNFETNDIKNKLKLDSMPNGNLFVGLVVCLLGFWGLYVWWWSVAEVLRGVVPIILILFGLVAIGAGISKKQTNNQVDEK